MSSEENTGPLEDNSESSAGQMESLLCLPAFKTTPPPVSTSVPPISQCLHMLPIKPGHGGTWLAKSTHPSNLLHIC
ncbi:unnamed protein product [Gadus morhua 'NCC']